MDRSYNLSYHCVRSYVVTRIGTSSLDQGQGGDGAYVALLRWEQTLDLLRQLAPARPKDGAPATIPTGPFRAHPPSPTCVGCIVTTKVLTKHGSGYDLKRGLSPLLVRVRQCGYIPRDEEGTPDTAREGLWTVSPLRGSCWTSQRTA